jgi:Glycosyl transferase family 2
MAQILVRDVAMAAIDLVQLAGAWIDRPWGGQRLDGHEVAVEGWVVGRQGAATAVELVCDGAVVARAPVGLPRSDTARTLAGFPGAERSGFHIRTSVLSSTGELELGVRAVLRDHSTVPLGAVRVQRGWRPGEGERVGAALVSVVIPSYNQGRFLGEAIESVSMQTYPHLEVVVVDDGSTDNTEKVAARYPGVKCIRQANQGLAAARNTGLRNSSGN